MFKRKMNAAQLHRGYISHHLICSITSIILEWMAYRTNTIVNGQEIIARKLKSYHSLSLGAMFRFLGGPKKGGQVEYL